VQNIGGPNTLWTPTKLLEGPWPPWPPYRAPHDMTRSWNGGKTTMAAMMPSAKHQMDIDW